MKVNKHIDALGASPKTGKTGRSVNNRTSEVLRKEVTGLVQGTKSSATNDRYDNQGIFNDIEFVSSR